MAPPCWLCPWPTRSSASTTITSPPAPSLASGLYLAQTPQVFRRDLLFKAYAQRSRVAGAYHRRLPARRGLGPSLRGRRRLGAQYQDHDARWISKLAAAILPLLEKPKREALGSSLLRRTGHVGQPAQAEALGLVWLVTGKSRDSLPPDDPPGDGGLEPRRAFHLGRRERRPFRRISCTSIVSRLAVSRVSMSI